MGFSCENHKDPTTKAFIRQSSIAVREPIWKATMPLLNVEGGYLWATGVLLRIRDKHFILTAAHVFDYWKTRPIPINVTDKVFGNQWFPIGEATLRRPPTIQPENRLIDDLYDMCVCDVPSRTANRIVAGGECRFLELSEVDPWDNEDLRNLYTVFGFPGELNPYNPSATSVGSNACAFTTFIYGGEHGDIPWGPADVGVGILMDYGADTTRDDSDQPVPPPDPHGMSGGGMWRVAEHGCDMANWSTRDLKLIGVQSAWYEDQQVLRGTRIEHHLGMIYRGHEDLRSEIDSHFGPEQGRKWLNG